MDELKKAKEKYDSIEIPPELRLVVRSAIENKKEKKKNLFVIRRVLPLVACFAIVVVAAFTGLTKSGHPSVVEETNAPMPAAMTRNLPQNPTAENEIVNEFGELGKTISAVAINCKTETGYQIAGK